MKLAPWYGFEAFSDNIPLPRPGVYMLVREDGSYIGASTNLIQRLKGHEYSYKGFCVIPLFYYLKPNLDDLYLIEAAVIKNYSDSELYNVRPSLQLGFITENSKTNLRNAMAVTNSNQQKINKQRKTINKTLEDPEVRGRYSVKTDTTKLANFTNAMQLVWRDPKRNAKLSAARKSKLWITNGIDTQAIPIGTQLPEGWRLGRTLQMKPARWITNGVLSKLVEVNSRTPTGWRLGRTVSWKPR